MIKDGVIDIYKPAGWTSQDVCAKLRGRLHIKKIGHTGTLDPMATGVLPVCIGNATRIIEYYDMDRKSYHATMQLGVETDTLDITGNMLKTAEISHITEEMISGAFLHYTGVISQIPPKYSAVRINGHRAYELAREGKEVNIKPRTITVYSNEITAVNLELGTVEFDVTCSKGTYIRSFIDDIGHYLGCGATMTALERTASGIFTVSESTPLSALVEMSDEEIENLIIPADKTISNLGTVDVSPIKMRYLVHGNTILSQDYRITAKTDFADAYRMYCDGRFIGIGNITDNTLKPTKIIANTDENI